MPISKLEQLEAMTVVVADTGDIEAVRRLAPQDCTTNPTLLLKAVEMPQYELIVQEAIQWGKKLSFSSHDKVVSSVCDYLAVAFGSELAKIVPGRVSTEVDADLSFDTKATVEKAKSLVASYAERGIGRRQILIKIAATWEGIRAAEILQKEGIDCNLTLVFSQVQAIACADAGVYLISPFVGRILDWHLKNGGGPYTSETDPGVLSVREIYNYYKRYNIKTVVMGASFRNIGEIEALAGCDRLTISPALIDELKKSFGDLPRKLNPSSLETSSKPEPMEERTFRFLMNEDTLATEKLSEGIRLFTKDLRILRQLISKRLS